MGAELELAVEALSQGLVVAVATESFFGLLADISQPRALDRLFALKPRGADKGVPLLLPSFESWNELVTEVPLRASVLAQAHWPGPLTIALPARTSVDPRIALDGRVAVRLPGASPAASLTRTFGRPLTATSANLPGEPPATSADAVRASFLSAIPSQLRLVEGQSSGGLPSTVVVVEHDELRVIRSGALDPEAVRRTWTNSTT